MRWGLLAVAALVVVGLAVPTAAVSSGEDDVEDVVTLSPHDGPNGQYASIDDGELRVDFDGLNEEANTLAHDVFTIESTAEDTIRVWVETNTTGNVTAYESDDPDAVIDGRDDARELQPGETLDVGFEIDTRGRNPENGTVTIGVLVPDDDGTADIVVTDARTLQDETVVGKSLGVEATLENRGDAGGTRTVNLTVDGTVVASDSAFVPAGGTETVRFDHTFSEPGTYTLAVDGVEAGTVTVHPAGQAVVSVVDASVADERVPAGGRATVSATVENVGDTTGTGTVNLTVDGRVTATRTLTLAPGERREVGFSRQFDDPGTYRLGVDAADAGTVTVVAADGDDGGGTRSDDGTGTPGEGPDGEEPPADGGVEVDVIFDGGVGNQADVAVTQRDALPEDDPSWNTTAVIDPARVLGMPDDGLTVKGSRFVTRPGEEVQLTGSRSLIGSADGISRETRTAAIVEVTTPQEFRDSAATVRIRVDREQFPATDPADARIGRRTENGWQLLPTRVVEETDETVLLEARTFGFGTFTVFAESEVSYEWTLPNGTTVARDQLRTAFDEPGRYDVTLAVTDAFGRSDEARQAILVNDPPSVTVEGAENDTADEETTLRANVTNEIGNATVTWLLPDGSTATGREVTGTFAPGEVVRVTVEDEFGATGRTEATVGGTGSGGSDGVGPLPRFASLPLPFPARAGAGLVGLAVLLSALAARSDLVWRVGAGISDVVGVAGRALASDTPRVTALENPAWNPERGCIEIDDLAVEAPSGLLDSVEITVADESGDVVVSKTIEVGARASYSAAPERISVYGGAGVSPGGTYTIRVQAVDGRQRVGTWERTQARLSTTVAEF